MVMRHFRKTTARHQHRISRLNVDCRTCRGCGGDMDVCGQVAFASQKFSEIWAPKRVEPGPKLVRAKIALPTANVIPITFSGGPACDDFGVQQKGGRHGTV